MLEFSRVNVFKTLELVTLQIVLVVRALAILFSCVCLVWSDACCPCHLTVFPRHEGGSVIPWEVTLLARTSEN